MTEPRGGTTPSLTARVRPGADLQLTRGLSLAVCQPACQHGGLCIRPGYCHCVTPWEGDHCQV